MSPYAPVRVSAVSAVASSNVEEDASIAPAVVVAVSVAKAAVYAMYASSVNVYAAAVGPTKFKVVVSTLSRYNSFERDAMPPLALA